MTKENTVRPRDPSQAGQAGEMADDMVAEDIHRALLEHEPDGTTTEQRRALSAGDKPIPRWIFGWLGRNKLVEATGEREKRQLTDLGRECLATPERIEELLGGSAKFTRRVDRKLGAFAREHDLPTEPNRPWILANPADWKLNLWEGIRASKMLPPHEDRHTWVHHLRSSQAFALNLFAPLARSVGEPGFAWARGVWRPFFDGVSAVEFEYPGTGDPLGETSTSDHRTRVDVRIEYGQGQVALIEVKYTEPCFGGCSAYYSDANDAAEVCRAPGWSLDAARRCYLAKTKKRNYFEGAAASCFGFAHVEKYAHAHEGCPFHGGVYQIMRNARMIDFASPGAEFIVVAPRGNPALHLPSSLYGKTTMETFLGWAVPGTRTRYLDFESIIKASRNVSDARDWLGYMESKYLRAIEGAS